MRKQSTPPLTSLPGAMSRIGALTAVCVLVLGIFILWLVDPVALRSLRLAQFDQFQRWHPRPYTEVAVRVVDIDEASLKAYGQWPWPRSRVAELVERLQADGAAAIAFDVLLVEPDRTAPAAMAQIWRDPQISALLSRLPDPDRFFGRYCGREAGRSGKQSSARRAFPQRWQQAVCPSRHALPHRQRRFWIRTALAFWF
jgi:adenylate cyclase